MSMRTKATILRIILLQTRHFAGANQTVLVEFKSMCEKLTAKDMSILEAEVPAQLYDAKPLSGGFVRKVIERN